MNLLLWALQYI